MIVCISHWYWSVQTSPTIMDQWPKKHNSSENLMNYDIRYRKRADSTFPWSMFKIYEMRHRLNRESELGSSWWLVLNICTTGSEFCANEASPRQVSWWYLLIYSCGIVDSLQTLLSSWHCTKLTRCRFHKAHCRILLILIFITIIISCGPQVGIETSISKAPFQWYLFELVTHRPSELWFAGSSFSSSL